MGVRNTDNRDFSQELARVKRRIDQAIFELTEARNRMANNPPLTEGRRNATLGESELSTLCISLELSLADAIACAHRLSEKVLGWNRSAAAASHR